jgi:hypothetical protein
MVCSRWCPSYQYNSMCVQSSHECGSLISWSMSFNPCICICNILLQMIYVSDFIKLLSETIYQKGSIKKQKPYLSRPYGHSVLLSLFIHTVKCTEKLSNLPKVSCRASQLHICTYMYILHKCVYVYMHAYIYMYICIYQLFAITSKLYSKIVFCLC